MAKIKIAVSKQAAKEAAEKGDFEHVKPGLYVMEVTEINSGYSKNEKGVPDKKRPRLEVILKPVGAGREKAKLDQQYGNLWDYVSFSEDTEWKRAELMHALGKSLKGQGFEIENDPGKPGTDVGKLVLVRVKSDTDQQGNYKPRVGRLLPFVDEDSFDEDDDTDEEETDDEETDDVDDDSEEDEDDDDDSDDSEDEDDDDEDSDDDDSDDEDSDDDEDDDEEEDEDEGYTESELKAMSEKQLKKVAKELDLNPAKYKTPAKLIKAILKEQETPFD